MKSFIVALCIFACAYASEQTAAILRSESSQSPDGAFQYGFETDNGISAQAEGKVTVTGKDEATLQVSGSNTYKSPEGDIYSVSYIADQNGYQPQGAHLPTPPAPEPIPDYIARSIAYIAAHPYTEPKQ